MQRKQFELDRAARLCASRAIFYNRHVTLTSDTPAILTIVPETWTVNSS